MNCGTTRRGGDASRLDLDTGGDGVMDSSADGAKPYTRNHGTITVLTLTTIIAVYNGITMLTKDQ